MDTVFQHTAARRRLAICPPYKNSYDVVSTHSRPKAAGSPAQYRWCDRRGFNTQPPEGGWAPVASSFISTRMFQHTAARRRLGVYDAVITGDYRVSTHSRPKAAGIDICIQRLVNTRFNTQPPEGGWSSDKTSESSNPSFNTQPPEGGWPSAATTSNRSKRFNTQPPEGGWKSILTGHFIMAVSTHSRPKAAGFLPGNLIKSRKVSTHSRPKAAGTAPSIICKPCNVSTHSRPKAAGLPAR